MLCYGHITRYQQRFIMSSQCLVLGKRECAQRDGRMNKRLDIGPSMYSLYVRMHVGAYVGTYVGTARRTHQITHDGKQVQRFQDVVKYCCYSSTRVSSFSIQSPSRG